jgi:hypothetical protein
MSDKVAGKVPPMFQPRPLAEAILSAPLQLTMAAHEARQRVGALQREIDEAERPSWLNGPQLTPAGRDMLQSDRDRALAKADRATADLHLWLARELVAGRRVLTGRREPDMPFEAPCAPHECSGVKFDCPEPGAATLRSGVVLWDAHTGRAKPEETGGTPRALRTGQAPAEINLKARAVSRDSIVETARAIYRESADTGNKPPNINEAASQIRRRLGGGSRAAIREVLNESEFSSQRIGRGSRHQEKICREDLPDSNAAN